MQKNLRQIFGTEELDKKSIEFLTNALEKNNIKGFDYIEFKQSLAALTEMNLDVPTAIKSAFATASTVGLTKDKLLQTAEHYQQVLNKEKIQFDAALQKQVEQRIAGKQQEVQKLRQQIVQYQDQIKKLEDQIQRSQSTIDNADQHIAEAKAKIQETKTKFETTFASVFQQINEDINNIKTYL